MSDPTKPTIETMDHLTPADWDHDDTKRNIINQVYRLAVLQKGFREFCLDPRTARSAVEEAALSLYLKVRIPADEVFLFTGPAIRQWHVMKNLPEYEPGSTTAPDLDPLASERYLACTYIPYRNP